MSLLKQSTAVTIRLGPAVDKTDGVTEETALTPAVEVSKNHGAFAARSSAGAISHDSNGWYAVPLDATDTGTLGPLTVKMDDAATHLPVWREFLVVPANVYDALVGGSDKLDVNTAEVGGTAQTAGDLAAALQTVDDYVDEVEGTTKRILGLSQDNWVMDDTTYDGDGNLTAATIYGYDSAANATTHDKSTGLLYKWTLTGTITAGNLTLAKQLRVT